MTQNFKRIIDLSRDLDHKSVFLLGPRQTGKTYFLSQTYPDLPIYNLLKSDVFFRLSQRPHLLREELLALTPRPKAVIIDEIQKLPVLLDEIQILITEGFHFILTGSSARKLKRGGANLLGGRARMRHLHPLTTAEIPNYSLERILTYGSLPSIYPSDQPAADLMDYLGTYLQEEIQAEGLSRKIENFSRFLEVAALTNTQLLNFTQIASDCGVPARSVREYYQILEDTLVGTMVAPFQKTKKRKSVATSKFYFFDPGVSRMLAGHKGMLERPEDFGQALEHFIFNELRAYADYSRLDLPVMFWRAINGQEVDFVVGDQAAIEVKAATLVTERHASGLKALSEEKVGFKHRIVVSMDPVPRQMGEILVLPVRDFLARLWGGHIFSS